MFNKDVVLQISRHTFMSIPTMVTKQLKRQDVKAAVSTGDRHSSSPARNHYPRPHGHRVERDVVPVQGGKGLEGLRQQRACAMKTFPVVMPQSKRPHSNWTQVPAGKPWCFGSQASVVSEGWQKVE